MDKAELNLLLALTKQNGALIIEGVVLDYALSHAGFATEHKNLLATISKEVAKLNPKEG